ncbi:MAG: ABC transporter substrate-binding protein [Trueperaceae bacterium]
MAPKEFSKRIVGLPARLLMSLAILVSLSTVGIATAQDDVLRVGVTSFQGEVFDPTLVPITAAYQFLIFDSLVDLNSQGTELDPGRSLATSWESSDDNRVWTFHLREGVEFWDGEAVTAEDVKFSILRYWREEARASNISSIEEPLGGDAEADERVEIIDDHTIRFHLTEPIFYWPELLSPFNSSAALVLPKHWIEEHGEDAFVTNPMGSGPYRLVESVAGSMQVFEAVPDHPFRAPRYERIEFMQVSEESTRLAMLQTGELDLANMSLERLPALESNDLEVVTKVSGTLWTVLFVEAYQDPVLGKRSVREAIMMAIDKETLNQAFFNGVAEPVNDGGNIAQIFDPDNRVTRAPVPYDPERAREIVEAEVPDDYELRIHAVIRGPIRMDHIEAIAAMLSAVGFNVEISAAADYSTFRNGWNTGMAGSGLYLKDGRKYLIYYPSSYAHSPEFGGRHSVIQVPPGPETREVHPDLPDQEVANLRAFDEELEALRTASSWDEYWDIYSGIMDRAIDQLAPGSGLFYTPAIFGARPGVVPEWDVTLGMVPQLWLPNIVELPPTAE